MPGTLNVGGHNIITHSGTSGAGTVDADNIDTVNIGNNALVVDSSGNVGIGTASPQDSLHIVESTTRQLRVEGNAPTLYFKETDGSADQNYQIRLDGGGLAIQTNNDAFTSASSKLTVNSGGNTSISNSVSNSSPLSVANPSAGSSGFGCIQTSLNSNASGTGTHHIKMTTQNVASYYIYGNGTTAFGSDERLKKNIETTRDGYIEDIKNLRVVKYHWKDQDESTPKELGLVAQEVEQVFPGLVQEHELENVADDIKHIKVSVIPFILVKAMQEQQALIESQQSKIDTLTAKTQEQDLTIASLISRIEALENA